MKATFSQWVPLWNKKLKRGFTKASEPCEIDGQELDMGKYSKCVLGEAYRFQIKSETEDGYSVYDNHNDPQYCGECHMMAYEFDKRIKSLSRTKKDDLYYKDNISEFRNLKKRFTDHMNEYHPELLAEKKK